MTTDLMDQFVAEARELVDQSSAALIALEKAPGDEELLNTVFRAMHTLKGSSGLFEVAPLTRLVHVAENALSAVRSHEVVLTSDLVDLLLETLDLVGAWLPVLEGDRGLPPDAADVAAPTVAALDALLETVDPAGSGVLAPLAAGACGGEASPQASGAEWVAGAPEEERLGLLVAGAVSGRPVLAVRYVPSPQCFFGGDDPLRTVGRVPDRVLVRASAVEPWRSPREFDPYLCNLVFEVFTTADQATLEEVFLYVRDEVEIRHLEPLDLVRAEGPVADPRGAADLGARGAAVCAGKGPRALAAEADAFLARVPSASADAMLVRALRRLLREAPEASALHEALLARLRALGAQGLGAAEPPSAAAVPHDRAPDAAPADPTDALARAETSGPQPHDGDEASDPCAPPEVSSTGDWSGEDDARPEAGEPPPIFAAEGPVPPTAACPHEEIPSEPSEEELSVPPAEGCDAASPRPGDRECSLPAAEERSWEASPMAHDGTSGEAASPETGAADVSGFDGQDAPVLEEDAPGLDSCGIGGTGDAQDHRSEPEDPAGPHAVPDGAHASVAEDEDLATIGTGRSEAANVAGQDAPASGGEDAAAARDQGDVLDGPHEEPAGHAEDRDAERAGAGEALEAGGRVGFADREPDEPADGAEDPGAERFGGGEMAEAIREDALAEEEAPASADEPEAGDPDGAEADGVLAASGDDAEGASASLLKPPHPVECAPPFGTVADEPAGDGGNGADAAPLASVSSAAPEGREVPAQVDEAPECDPAGPGPMLPVDPPTASPWPAAQDGSPAGDPDPGPQEAAAFAAVAAAATSATSAASPARASEPPSGGGGEGGSRRPEAQAAGGANRVLKVDQARIDALMGFIGELVVAKNALPYLSRRAATVYGSRAMARELKDQYAVIDRITQDMQEAIMAVRMLPVGQIFQRFPRLVRDVSRRLGKEIELVVEGEDTEADKTVVENLADPLVHILRNAIDHGIEPPDEREASGKPRAGTIRLSAFHEGDRVVIEVADDGVGIDVERVRTKAVERGLVEAERAAAMSPAEVANLVFLPGFSTRDTVSDLSGRGVGMDVVRTAIDRAGGTVSLATERGEGSRVRLSLPLTMAVTRVMTIECGAHLYGVPMELICETVRVPRERLTRVKDREVFVLREAIIPILRLSGLLGLPPAPSGTEEGEAVMVIALGDERIGIVVNAFRDVMEVIVKPLEGMLAGLPGYTGTALMGDGRVVLVLDIKELVACR